MAEIALACLISKLESLRPDEVAVLEKMGADIFSIKEDLEKLQHFQRHTDVVEENSLELEIFVKDLREAAQESEDAVDNYLFHMAYQSYSEASGSRMYAFVKRFLSVARNSAAPINIPSSGGLLRRITNRWFPSEDICTPLKDIKPKFLDIIEKNPKLELMKEHGSNTPPASRYKYQEDAHFLKDPDLVGIEEPRQKLIKLLVNSDDAELRIIPVVGMGGLGKTTLVKNVYDDNKVKVHFQSHAWITVSQTFKIEELLRDLTQQIYGENRTLVPPETEEMNTEDLKRQIHTLLNRTRYLIVLDDVWSVDIWISIKIAFPGNNKGSRVMLTTRNADVAFSTSDTTEYIYNLHSLSEKDSWTLFCNNIYNGPCPEHLVKISEAILKKCGGLPLAIAAISGVLTTKNPDDPNNWMKVDGSLGAELEDNRRLKSTYKILALSYNDLPHYLKACFLYMSIFPEDHPIEPLKLIRLWMAEGFLSDVKDKAPEDVGQSYLSELVSRNLVQAGETSSDGRMKTCHVHDLLREIITVKSRDENIVTVSKNGGQYPKNARRLSLQNSLYNFQQNQNLSQLRSLLMFEVQEPLTASSIPSLFYTGLKLLTVLDLQGTNLKRFPTAIVQLPNLRYLSLKDTQVKAIPNSIAMLQKLQTLNLKHTLISKIPAEILKLQQLRNLLIYRYEYGIYADFPSRYGFKAPSGIRDLTCLRTLCSVEGGQGCSTILRELEMLTQLRRLAVIELSEENGPLLCSSVVKLTNLLALSISAAKGEILELQYLRYPPENLRRLYLTGQLDSLPAWTGSLKNLAKIFLKSSRLQADENPLKAFEDLPNLVHVEFLQVYTGNALYFKACTFKKLKILGLHEFESLKTVTIEETAMPSLERFVIKTCPLLKTLPKGIHYLKQLKILDFINMPGELISSVKLLLTTGEANSSSIHHIPVVNHIEKVESIWETKRLNVVHIDDENPTKSPHVVPMRNLEDFNKK